jgi:fatty acid desaturase
MPYYAEHHLCPAVPCHRLPALPLAVRGRQAHIAPGEFAANLRILKSLRPGHRIAAF